jgi:hypothetical protein
MSPVGEFCGEGATEERDVQVKNELLATKGGKEGC